MVVSLLDNTSTGNCTGTGLFYVVILIVGLAGRD
jgi:hypothetical protein